ncbi:hypothetical protein, conserved [Trypanosoma brucei gambiense DAL972]|uniref:Uncharacterized protein n=2 Tax=Trypanosoma brucei TaxID=5691 RepID=D0A2V6_TRYB9|nr:hypothetical protein, conserved [Trypanosoma brucei gambiense DAL972]CBH15600.1 hypothetical protein, conserved [Trypanosoma brucei gambiense DAL972]|eukprot:XP_011777864.1 hypothetical protein, conserved [Trypanosoma brucei gambiense DAL972]
MEDDADAYLRRVSQLKRKHFRKDSVTAYHPTPVEVETVDTKPIHTVARRLPMKKRKRMCDDDEFDVVSLARDAVNVSSCGVFVADGPSTSPLVGCNGDRKVLQQPVKITLMEKWFPGRTLQNATLDPAQAPLYQYTEVSTKRMKDARERFVTLKAGVEDALKYSFVGECTNFDEVVSRMTKESWIELRNTLFQISSRASLRRKKGAVRAMKYILSTNVGEHVPKSSILRHWNEYLLIHGPEQGFQPTLSLFVWVESAGITALFTAVVSRALKLFKQGKKPMAYSFYDAQEEAEPSCCVEAATSEEDECVDSGEVLSCEGSVEKSAKESEPIAVGTGEGNDDNSVRPPSLVERLPRLGGCSEDVISLLSFLRVLMPVDYLDEDGRMIGRSAGYGVWLYACLTAVDTPFDPDLDRLVHEFFRTCCLQLRVLGEAHNVRGDDRGAILKVFPSRKDDPPQSSQYNSLGDVRKEDVLALHTIIVVLAKLFRLNGNRLVPL